MLQYQLFESEPLLRFCKRDQALVMFFPFNNSKLSSCKVKQAATFLVHIPAAVVFFQRRALILLAGVHPESMSNGCCAVTALLS